MIWPFRNRTTEKILDGLREPVWKVEPPRPWPDPPQSELTNGEINDLATYNSEVARGIVHTDEWKARMSELQTRWNNRKRA